MSLHIVYDIDDVLADFWNTALPIFNYHFNTNLKKEDITSYNSFADDVNITKADFLEFVACQVPLLNLNPTKLIKVMNDQHKFGHEISIVTSRDYIGGADHLTKTWLERHGANYHNLFISGERKKSSFFDSESVDIVYDDHHHNLDDYLDSGVMTSKGVCVIINQPWNKSYERDGVLRMKNGGLL